MTRADLPFIEREARKAWDEMNAGFPQFTRQKWEHGTYLARRKALHDAAERLGYLNG